MRFLVALIAAFAIYCQGTVGKAVDKPEEENSCSSLENAASLNDLAKWWICNYVEFRRFLSDLKPEFRQTNLNKLAASTNDPDSPRKTEEKSESEHSSGDDNAWAIAGRRWGQFWDNVHRTLDQYHKHRVDAKKQYWADVKSQWRNFWESVDRDFVNDFAQFNNFNDKPDSSEYLRGKMGQMWGNLWAELRTVLGENNKAWRVIAPWLGRKEGQFWRWFGQQIEEERDQSETNEKGGLADNFEPDTDENFGPIGSEKYGAEPRRRSLRDIKNEIRQNLKTDDKFWNKIREKINDDDDFWGKIQHILKHDNNFWDPIKAKFSAQDKIWNVLPLKMYYEVWDSVKDKLACNDKFWDVVRHKVQTNDQFWDSTRQLLNHDNDFWDIMWGYWANDIRDKTILHQMLCQIQPATECVGDKVPNCFTDNQGCDICYCPREQYKNLTETFRKMVSGLKHYVGAISLYHHLLPNRKLVSSKLSEYIQRPLIEAEQLPVSPAWIRWLIALVPYGIAPLPPAAATEASVAAQSTAPSGIPAPWTIANPAGETGKTASVIALAPGKEAAVPQIGQVTATEGSAPEGSAELHGYQTKSPPALKGNELRIETPAPVIYEISGLGANSQVAPPNANIPPSGSGEGSSPEEYDLGPTLKPNYLALQGETTAAWLEV